jgi:hypothetical protein
MQEVKNAQEKLRQSEKIYQKEINRLHQELTTLQKRGFAATAYGSIES